MLLNEKKNSLARQGSGAGQRRTLKKSPAGDG